jgi:hypothetical protein
LAIAVPAITFSLSLAIPGEPAKSQSSSRPCGGNPDPLPTERLDAWCDEIRGIEGKCLDVEGGSSTDGTRVILWPCNGGINQRWKVLRDGKVLGIDGKCLDVRGGSSENGAPVIIWACHSGDNQRWEITDKGELRGTGKKCLDPSGWGAANGAPIILWPCHGRSNQWWKARYAS